MEREGFSTITANSGKDAITWLLRNHADLLLLDLKLPDIQGKALVDHLAEIHRSVPFLVITGQGDERVAVEMMKRGALDYLVKDVDYEALRQISMRTLARSGYVVTPVEDGLQAWEALQADRYDLLITDNDMPRLTGLQLIKRVRSARMRLPVIVASGTVNTEDRRRSVFHPAFAEGLDEVRSPRHWGLNE